MNSLIIKFQICLVFLIASSFFSIAQTDVDSIADSDQIIFGPIEIRPQFPGGEIALFCFIDKNIDKEILSSCNLEGTSFAKFTIDTLGLVKNVEIAKSLDETIDAEFVRVLKLLPQWEPGSIRGILVETNYVIPLKIPYKSKCLTEK